MDGEQGVHLQLRSPLNRKPIIARNNECPHKSYCDIQNSCPNDYHACEYSSENLLGVV